MKQKPVTRRRVSFGVALILTLVAAAIGGAASAIKVRDEFADERARLAETTDNILATATYPAARAVHTLDDVLASEIVKSLMKHPFVIQAQIADERGFVLAADARTAAVKSRSSWLPVALTIRHHAVDLAIPGSAKPGRLAIDIDEHPFFLPLLDRTFDTIVAELVKTFAFALVAFLLLWLMVTRPLFRLAGWFAAIDPARPGDVPGPVPLGDSGTEFGLLARTGDAFRVSISTLMAQKAEYEAELEHARDRLEVQVVQRTRALAEEIEERKAIQTTLEETNDNLEHLVAERTAKLQESMAEAVSANAAKTIFLANMSHELRTPLNSVIGFSQMMSGELFGPMPKPYKEYVDIVIRSGEHLLRLINDVLDMTKVESGRLSLERKPTDPAVVVEEAIGMVAELARANGVDLIADYGPCDTIDIDPTRIRQAVLNVVSNAIKFSPNGTVRVRVETVDAECRIRVGDTGIGMSREDIEIAFLPFGQAERTAEHRRFEGTGLGLPIAKRLVELHGGTFGIASAPGEGTTVTITLPIEAAPPSETAAAT